jgi:rRNA maturation endonuclease Nob1
MGQYTTEVTLINSAVETPVELVNELTYKVECINCGDEVKKGSKCGSCGKQN